MIQPAFFRRAAPEASRSVYLWRTLVAQELKVRYRGTFLGSAWQLLAPLFLLGIYGFVFGVVFGARWPGFDESDRLMFALNLFLGLAVHGVLAETLGLAPTAMQRNSNFVRKVVFPLPVLVAVPLGVAFVNALSGVLIVFLVAGIFGKGWSALLWQVVPVLAALGTMVYGLALLLAALGVFVRDLGQMIGMVVTALLFTSPVFYPVDMAPQALRGIIQLNPLTVPVEHLRGAVLLHHAPDWSALGIYSVVALLVLALGWTTFQHLRRGFADAL